MTTELKPSPDATRLERTYDARAEVIWELWTTAAGLEKWLVPDGFETRVTDIELRPGGQLRYTMTATGPEQVAFVKNLGLPLTSEFRRTLTEVAARRRLAWLSLIGFVPGQEPFEHLTVIDIEPCGESTTVVVTLDPLHDETWTREYRAHRANELDKLDAVVRARHSASDTEPTPPTTSASCRWFGETRAAGVE
ncbi:MAG: SRPBCC domain-containing protein [Solirubrobacterales bacterium]|nr:SRPBCC domain-containing protein [Solirubrobacterales bacterium]